MADERIYIETFEEAVERNRPRIPEVNKQLEGAGVKYVMAAWIDLHGIPKTKPVPISDFEQLCLGKGPQFVTFFRKDCGKLVFQSAHEGLPLGILGAGHD